MGAKAATFASAKHLSSWVGTCPGEEESAGVNSSPRSAKGNRQMRRILNQAANAAVKHKGSMIAGIDVHKKKLAVVVPPPFSTSCAPATAPSLAPNPSPPSGWVEDLHLRAVEHARHTTKSPMSTGLGCVRARPRFHFPVPFRFDVCRLLLALSLTRNARVLVPVRAVSPQDLLAVSDSRTELQLGFRPQLKS